MLVRTVPTRSARTELVATLWLAASKGAESTPTQMMPEYLCVASLPSSFNMTRLSCQWITHDGACRCVWKGTIARYSDAVVLKAYDFVPGDEFMQMQSQAKV
jgi:hypothetical protein